MESPTPIKYKIKQILQPGPGCMWRINRPDLGFVGDGYIFDVLKNNIIAWRKANGIPVGLGFEDELEQALCAQYPDMCKTDDPREPLKPVGLSFGQVVLGTKVAAGWGKSGFKVVDRDEAQRRANICAGCKFNVPFSKACGGGICGDLLDIVKKVVSKPVIGEDKLEACFICKCFIKVAIWIPREIQWDPMGWHMKEQFDQAPWCWKGK